MPKREAAISPDFTSLKRISPTSHVRTQLLTAIESGKYPPGSMLPSERVLCDTFGVSRVSVRAALAGIEATGLIRIEHGRGAYVRESANDAYAGPFARYVHLHRDELIELLRVRGALDELAADEAAANATSASIKRVQSAAQAFAKAAQRQRLDFEQLADLDIAFHMAIANAGGGALLPQLLDELNHVLTESRRMTLSRPGQLEKSVAEHDEIARAIADGDAATARRAVRKHISHVRKLVAEFKLSDSA